jgi:2-dehydropantoate 2-reductase
MSQTTGQRVGIIGTGAIGGFYGLMLARAGMDVHFLLRSEYSAVVENGIHLNSAEHGELVLNPVQACADVADMPPCDWLLVGAKSTGNAELAPLINRAAAPGAKVVLLQNGMGAEEALRPLLDDSLHLLGGLCFICVHRAGPGIIEHQSQGMVNLGYHSGPASTEERQHIVEQGVGFFRAAGVPSTPVSSLEHARWHKLIWNIPFNGLSVLLNSGTSGLMQQADTRALIEALMNEVVEGAAACGHAMPEGLVPKMMMGTERMGFDYLPSMYHDFLHKRPLELQAIYAEPLAAAAAAGAELPRIRMLYQSLRFIDQRNLA